MSPATAADDQARFDALQRKLVPLWTSIRALNQDEQTIVVVPSLDTDADLDATELQAYEERFLFLLLLLRQPRARLVYVTGQAIHPSIVDYYLDLMPGVISSHARRRLFLVSPLDGSTTPLAQKLLARPRLLERIRGLVPNPDRAHLVPFSTTWADREIAMALGIPMYGCDPRLLPWGTKTGSRRLFREEGVPHPAGREDLADEDALVEAIVAMRRDRPATKKVVVKLNLGVSGGGNANLSLAGLPPSGSRDERDAVRRALPGMKFESPALDWPRFLEKLADQHGIVEERIEADEIRSPSVQLRVTPLGDVELLSTHDQLLGGASGQSYLGCRFPADPAYAALISREALKVGRRLGREGVLGRFALDFVVSRPRGGGWSVHGIELNLRKGGTTHPFLTLQFLTDGAYDAESCEFTAPNGRHKYFVASDHVESPAYRVLTPDDLFDLALRHGLHFDQTRLTGIVFHMMSALPARGRTGLTAVADSPEEADRLYRRFLEVLDAETRPAGG
ncbi:MAG: hypothetical protein IT460_13760 [Planctomycetes bacterium]|nr:hypothetical protein [Planctomycetota bacterium]